MVTDLRDHDRLTMAFRFRDGSSALDSHSRSNVALLADAFDRGVYDGHDVIFAGFSDGQGDAAANLRLSRQRARVVRDALLAAMALPDFRDRGLGEGLWRGVAHRLRRRRLGQSAQPPGRGLGPSEIAEALNDTSDSLPTIRWSCSVDAQRLAGIPDPRGHLDVGLAGRRIAGGVVVDEDQRRGVQLERPLDHLARVDRHVIDGAARLFLVRDRGCSCGRERGCGTARSRGAPWWCGSSRAARTSSRSPAGASRATATGAARLPRQASAAGSPPVPTPGTVSRRSRRADSTPLKSPKVSRRRRASGFMSCRGIAPNRISSSSS